MPSMPTIEWLKYGALGLGLALATYSFVLVRSATKRTPVDRGRVVLLSVYIAFSLLLTISGFFSEYLAKHQDHFSRIAAKALLAESSINMRQDVAHCQSFLQRVALFLQAIGDDEYATVEANSRVNDTRCGDGVNSVAPLLEKYAK